MHAKCAVTAPSDGYYDGGWSQRSHQTQQSSIKSRVETLNPGIPGGRGSSERRSHPSRALGNEWEGIPQHPLTLRLRPSPSSPNSPHSSLLQTLPGLPFLLPTLVAKYISGLPLL